MPARLGGFVRRRRHVKGLPRRECAKRRPLSALQRAGAGARQPARVNEAMSAQGSPFARQPPQHRLDRPAIGAQLRVGQLVPLDRRGHGRARQRAHRVRRHRPSGRRRCASRRRGCARRARPCGTRWSARRGGAPASSAATSRANGLTSSKVARRRSGVHTWMPFEPVTWANGSRPISRSRSPVRRAARRTAAKSAPGAGSRSNTSRSGWRSRSARDSQTCGVIVFWPTR